MRKMRDDMLGKNLSQLINNGCSKCLDFYKENREEYIVVLTEESSTMFKEISQEFSILYVGQHGTNG
jgi:hypothetical protein